MPSTATERQRRSREKRKAEPEKYEEYLKKNRERKVKREFLSPDELTSMRIKGRESFAKHIAKKKRNSELQTPRNGAYKARASLTNAVDRVEKKTTATPSMHHTPEQQPTSSSPVIVEHKSNFGCWFIGAEVLSDGCIWYFTEIDPIFLVLPYLQDQFTANPERYSPLDQILEESQFPHTKKLLQTSGIKYLDVLTDISGEADYKAYKFNLHKTLKWLARKVERVISEYLSETSDVQSFSGAQSADFVRSKSESADPDAAKEYAFQLVSSYVNKELSVQLRSHLGLPEKVSLVNEENQQPKKKSKPGGPLEDYSQGFNPGKKVDQKPSALTKKLAKVDKTGIRSITSFFKPKSTK